MSDDLGSVVHWLDGINRRSDIHDLKKTNEYEVFMKAFQALEQSHRRAVSTNKRLSLDIISDSIVIRICDFLNCFQLASFSKAGSRFRTLCNLSAKQRTSHLNGRWNIQSHMHLLRAKEQAEGILPNSIAVRIPLLGLEKRVYVSSCSDHDFNGIYNCTGINGNGYVFSKPRFGNPQRVIDTDAAADADADARGEDLNSNGIFVHDEETFPCTSNEKTTKTPFLRCVISKRFSNDTLLWYLSKEVRVLGNNEGVKREFCFWTRLMTSEQGTPDTCIYPSQTSIQTQNGQPGWLSLRENLISVPPIVELVS